jgi:VWFA-related protein
LSICVVCPIVATSQQPRYRSSTDAVLVDVQVMAGGKPVTGLTAADFELKDSGVTQHIEAVSFADVPVSLLLALDVSASVSGERLEQLKQASRSAVDTLRPGDQAALLTIRDHVSRASGWTQDRDMLNRRIDALQAGGWTALHDAVVSAVSLSHRSSGRVIVLVFSDGADTTSWLDARAAIDIARQSDLVVTAVSAAPRFRPSSGREARLSFGVADALRRWFDAEPTLFPYAFLETLTEDTGGQLLHVESGNEIAAAFRRIVADFKTRYLLTYSPRGVGQTGWHPLEVRVMGRKAEVTARRGYWR